MTTQQPATETFDDFINADSATLAPPLEEPGQLPGTREVKAKRGKTAHKPPMGKQRKMMMGGGAVLLVVVAVMMFRKDDAPPQVASTANVAEILAQAQPPGSAPENALGAPFAGFEDVTPVEGTALDASGDPTLDALNAFALSADTAPVIGEHAAVDATEMSTPVETAASPLPAAPVAPSIAAVETPPSLDTATRMRIEGLENDLKRAREARRAAERNQRVPVTVVAVLDDGVVVRDARGREKVLAVGEQVKL